MVGKSSTATIDDVYKKMGAAAGAGTRTQALQGTVWMDNVPVRRSSESNVSPNV